MASSSSLQYIALDYEAHRNLLLQRVRDRWPGRWNDFLDNSFGRVLIDLAAWSTSTLAFTLNRAAAENFVSTMTLRESAVRLGSLVGYKLRNPVCATVMCNAQTASPVTAITTIPKGSAIQVSSGGNTATFEVANDYTIQVGKTTPREVVLSVAPVAAGQNSVRSTFAVTAGSKFADMADTTTDLSQLVLPGQTFEDPSGGTYTISDIQAAPDSGQKNRLIFTAPWAGLTGQTQAVISERRIELVEGQTYSEEFQISRNAGMQVIRLSRVSVVNGSTSVVADGIPWAAISNIFLASASDLVFEEKPLADGRTAVVFGDGQFGSQIPDSASVVVTYRVGGGSGGNVEVGSIKGTIFGTQVGGQVSVLVANDDSAGQGGQDQETLNEARQNIPRSIRANDRGITLEDYEFLASQFADPIQGAVRFARASANSNATLVERNIVTVKAWTTTAKGLTPISAGLKAALSNYLGTKAAATDLVVVLDGTQRPAPVSVRIKVIAGFSVQDTVAAVNASITAQISGVRPGDPIIFSDLVRAIADTTGVDNAAMATPVTDLYPSSSSEVLSVPDETYAYTLALESLEANTYSTQLPAQPTAPWAVSLVVSGEPVTVVPGLLPGQALVLGDRTTSGLSLTTFGLLADRQSPTLAGDFYSALDTGELFRSTLDAGAPVLAPTYSWVLATVGGCWIDLQTGKLTLSFAGQPGDVTVSLTTTAGYSATKPVNLQLVYTGVASLAKRREIRTAISAWFAGLGVGDPAYLSPVLANDGSYLVPASASNLTHVVQSVTGVQSVTRMVANSVNTAAGRVDAAGYELLVAGSIAVNGQLD